VKQPEDTTHTQRAGQRPEGNDPQTQYRNDRMAGTWSPSGLHDGLAGEEQILGAIFDRLAEAAAAHDDETAAEGIEEIKAGLAAPHGGPGQRPDTS
jgi:hypothetical protein